MRSILLAVLLALPAFAHALDIDSNRIEPGAVGTTELHDGSVTWAKLAFAPTVYTESPAYGDGSPSNPIRVATAAIPAARFSSFGIGGETTNSTWTVLDRGIWVGSGRTGTPDHVEIIAWTNNPAKAGAMRIYDATNAQVIVSTYGFVNIDPQIINLGDLGNVSVDHAVWEFQGASPDTGKTSIGNATLFYAEE